MSVLPPLRPSEHSTDPLGRARLVFRLVAARLDRSALELTELGHLLEPLLPLEVPEEEDHICRPGRQGLARSYTNTLEALLRGSLAQALADLDAALRATVGEPAPEIEDGDVVLARRLAALAPSLPASAGLEAHAVAAMRQLIAELRLAEDKETPMETDTPTAQKLKSERVQLAALGWRPCEPAGTWETVYPFASRTPARDFLNQAQALTAANGWPLGLTLHEEPLGVAARLSAGPFGLNPRHRHAIQALNRLYGREEVM